MRLQLVSDFHPIVIEPTYAPHLDNPSPGKATVPAEHPFAFGIDSESADEGDRNPAPTRVDLRQRSIPAPVQHINPVNMRHQSWPAGDISGEIPNLVEVGEAAAALTIVSRERESGKMQGRKIPRRQSAKSLQLSKRLSQRGRIVGTVTRYLFPGSPIT